MERICRSISRKESMKKTLATCLAAATLTGCGSLNSMLAERHETMEMYHVLDVKTQASPDTMIRATADGLAQNTGSIFQNRPLQVGAKIPATPGRFELVDVGQALGGTGLGAILAATRQGAPMRAAKCDGAIWTARAVREVTGSDALTLHTCIYRYRDGYQLNVYGVFQKASGGITHVARSAAQAVVGTPEEWTNKTLVDTIRSIEARTGARVHYVEGQPEIGDLPRLDKLMQR